ncbi:MAG: hypothetical protein K2X98_00125 [Alphaproteobacteria bacterium]|nr:hypothetical protein [Alphaproteobacteria bacterium]
MHVPQFLSRYPALSIIFLFILHTSLTWPGILSPDSETQYNMALQGVYSDHHPALMSFVWRYLNMICKGPGLMLGLHLGLLYASVYFFIRALSPAPYHFAFLFLPLIPHILVYSFMIWKDVGFAFSFLCIASYLTYCAVQEKKLSLTACFPLSILLIYGTAIKFQAQYCAPLLIFWMIYERTKAHFSWQKYLLCGLGSAIIFYSLLSGINNFLVQEKAQNHSWQYVKLYDLAALSVATQIPLFPESSKTEKFSMEKLKTTFNHARVDDLVFGHDALLVMGKNEQERGILWWTWAHQVSAHPLYYIKHRLSNLAYAAFSTPEYENILSFFSTTIQLQEPYASIIARTIGYLFFAHILPILLCFIYCGIGIFNLSKTPLARPLFFLNSIAVVYLTILLFFSMAGTPRYTYVVVCIVSTSHILAYHFMRRKPGTKKHS